jgi:hypothetical protein
MRSIATPPTAGQLFGLSLIVTGVMINGRTD